MSETLQLLMRQLVSTGIGNEYVPESTSRKRWTLEALGNVRGAPTRKTLSVWLSGGSFSATRVEEFCDAIVQHVKDGKRGEKARELDEEEIQHLGRIRQFVREQRSDAQSPSETDDSIAPEGPGIGSIYVLFRSRRFLRVSLPLLLAFLAAVVTLLNLGMFRQHDGTLSFKDCGNCPEMVVVPAGTFRTGSPSSERLRDPDEDLSAPITVKSFAISKEEISNGEFEFFKRQTGYEQAALCQKLTKDVGWFWQPDYNDNIKDPNWPEGCISYDDAQAYADWLNSLVEGSPYRIPSQIEWEYAARAGTETSYFWGSDPNDSCIYANLPDQSAIRSYPGWDEVVACDDGEDDGNSAGGQYLPNSFGLHDVTGSLTEWTSDCFDPAAYSAQHGTPSLEPSGCKMLYVRGGSWGTAPSTARIPDFRIYDRNKRHQQHGFRVVRDYP